MLNQTQSEKRAIFSRILLSLLLLKYGCAVLETFRTATETVAIALRAHGLQLLWQYIMDGCGIITCMDSAAFALTRLCELTTLCAHADRAGVERGCRPQQPLSLSGAMFTLERAQETSKLTAFRQL